MKKTIFSAIISFVLIGCSSSNDSFEQGVKRKAAYICEIQQIMGKGGVDEATEEKLEKIQEEVEKITKELNEKYGNIETNKELSEKEANIIKEVLANCK